MGDILTTFLTKYSIHITDNSFGTEKSMVYVEALDDNNQTLFRSFSTDLLGTESLPQVDWKTIDVCVILSSSKKEREIALHLALS